MSVLFSDGRSIEEALGLDRFDPAKHPRGRGGQFAEILGRIASLHRDLGGHPGVQNRLDRGQLHDGDVARIKSLARKKGSPELGRLVDEARGGRPQSPGGERHASVLFAPNTGGGGGLAPGHGATHLQSDELRSDRYRRSKKAGMFAQHRSGNLGGSAPGTGPRALQPDTMRTPGGERRNFDGPLGANARGTHFRFPAHADNPDLYRVEGRDEKGSVIATKVVAGTKHKFNPTEENYRRDERGAQAFLRKKPGSKMSRRQGHDLLTEAVVEMVQESLGGEIQHVFDEAKHPRGRGGKWTASFHGPVHGVQIPDVQVQGSDRSHLADQIRQHVEAHTGKKVEGVDVDFDDLRKGSAGDASGNVATRKALRARKVTQVSLKRTGDGPASPRTQRDTYEDRP